MTLASKDLATVVACAALMDLTQEETASSFENQTQFFHGSHETSKRVVTVAGTKYTVDFANCPETHELLVKITNGSESFEKRVSHQSWSVGQPLFDGVIDGQQVHLQV